ncbi:MAG TPA: bifunctional aspartate kinase/homoserine dehydrogenase I [Rubricoccaceae bacterium]
MSAPVVMKFGGSSLADADRIAHAVGLVAAQHAAAGDAAGPPVVVVSALGGVTDAVLALTASAAAERLDEAALQALHTRHAEAATGLLDGPERDGALADLDALHILLADLLRGMAALGEASPRATDRALVYGELVSALLVAAALRTRGLRAEALDAMTLVATDSAFGQAQVNEPETFRRIREAAAAYPGAVLVIPGFSGADPLGRPTTLGRGGSDLTASLVGAALTAARIEIWTDVDGVLTADPRLVEDAFLIPAMTYAEAAEMAHFGAKVLFPPTMRPAQLAGVPITVRNTFNADAPGTVVSETGAGADADHPVRGLTSVPRIALLTLSGAGLVGVPGVAARLFGALGREGISVVLITQASSENSIGVAVGPGQGETARVAVETEFAAEIARGSVAPVAVEHELSILAVVGEGMPARPGIAGRVFSALGHNGINVRAVAQGSSERNISVVVAARDEAKALAVVHDGLFLSDAARLHLFVIGTGLVGAALLDQISAQASALRRERGLEIRLAGVANSKTMTFAARGLDLADWRAARDAGEPSSPEAFVQRAIALNLPNAVVVDATAGAEVPALYDALLAASVSVSTPNKVALSGPQADYDRLKTLAARRGVQFRYETNVGAGLPVVSTLGDLVSSGDRIRRIEGVLSGTLSFIFATFTAPGATVRFSDVVRDAQARGYTEPDPRDDLSGADVRRKLLVLARDAGLRLEPEAAVIRPFLPAACTAAPSVAAFYDALAAHDGHFDAVRQEAAAAGRVLRALAVVDAEAGTAGLSVEAVGPEHPAFALDAGDNLVTFRTDRYPDRPLVVRGPGAGAEVTAAGVFAELVQIGGAIRRPG